MAKKNFYDEFSQLFDKASEADRLTRQDPDYKRMKNRAYLKFVDLADSAFLLNFKSENNEHSEGIRKTGI